MNKATAEQNKQIRELNNAGRIQLIGKIKVLQQSKKDLPKKKALETFLNTSLKAIHAQPGNRQQRAEGIIPPLTTGSC